MVQDGVWPRPAPDLSIEVPNGPRVAISPPGRLAPATVGALSLALHGSIVVGLVIFGLLDRPAPDPEPLSVSLVLESAPQTVLEPEEIPAELPDPPVPEAAQTPEPLDTAAAPPPPEGIEAPIAEAADQPPPEPIEPAPPSPVDAAPAEPATPPLPEEVATAAPPPAPPETPPLAAAEIAAAPAAPLQPEEAATLAAPPIDGEAPTAPPPPAPEPLAAAAPTPPAETVSEPPFEAATAVVLPTMPAAEPAPPAPATASVETITPPAVDAAAIAAPPPSDSPVALPPPPDAAAVSTPFPALSATEPTLEAEPAPPPEIAATASVEAMAPPVDMAAARPVIPPEPEPDFAPWTAPEAAVVARPLPADEAIAASPAAPDVSAVIATPPAPEAAEPANTPSAAATPSSADMPGMEVAAVPSPPPETVAAPPAPDTEAVVAAAPPPPEAAVARPQTGEALRLSVGRVLSQVGCGRVEGQAPAEAPGRLRLRGHVPDDTVRRRLLADLAALPGVEAVDANDLVLLPRPYCTVLDRVAATGAPMSAEQGDAIPRIGQAGQAGLLSYVDGQAIEIRIEAPSFDSHLRIAYVARDNSVFHLMPNDLVPDRLVPADSPIVLGGSDGEGYRLTAAPPYGLDLVVAVASDRPLFDSPREQGESLDAYLADLDRAIETRLGEGGQVEWAYLLIETKPP